MYTVDNILLMHLLMTICVAENRQIFHSPAFYRYTFYIQIPKSALSPARRYANADTSYGPVSVCQSVCLSQVPDLSKPLTNRAGWWLLEKGGRSERDKLHCRLSAQLTVPPSSGC